MLLVDTVCNEQVRGKDDDGAMHFARDILVRAAKTDSDYEELQNALSLMGYDDPQSSPCGMMMSEQVQNSVILTMPDLAPGFTMHCLHLMSSLY